MTPWWAWLVLALATASLFSMFAYIEWQDRKAREWHRWATETLRDYELDILLWDEGDDW